jgi:hypothetical protein
MLSTYSIFLKASGLSQREAAALHDVRIDTIKKWCQASGNRAPLAVVQELAALIVKQGEAADEVDDLVASRSEQPEIIELGVASDDHEAQALGWPTATAHAMTLAIVAARLIGDGHNVEIVPRGSTPASAAAGGQH